jgi:hypothetical protein
VLDIHKPKTSPRARERRQAAPPTSLTAGDNFKRFERPVVVYDKPGHWRPRRCVTQPAGFTKAFSLRGGFAAGGGTAAGRAS